MSTRRRTYGLIDLLGGMKLLFSLSTKYGYSNDRTFTFTPSSTGDLLVISTSSATYDSEYISGGFGAVVTSGSNFSISNEFDDYYNTFSISNGEIYVTSEQTDGISNSTFIIAIYEVDASDVTVAT